MKRTSATTEISAPLETVWSLIADTANHPTFDSTTVRILGPPADLGVKLRVYSTLTPDRVFPVRVVTYAPPRRMIWRGGMIFGLTKSVRTFALDPLAGNNTRFTLTEEFSGPLLRLVARSLPDMSEAFAGFCRGLKELAEAMAATRVERRRKH